jgi:hypothetical protein
MTPLQTLQAAQTTVANFDFTQTSGPVQYQILTLLNNITSAYATDLITNTDPATLATVITTITAARTASLAQTSDAHASV